MSNTPSTPTVPVADEHRRLAQQINQRAWELLMKADRSQRDDDELLYAAFASCYHWLQAGTVVHQQRGEYMIAKAYIGLNNPSEALAHAAKCLKLTEEHAAAMQDFDLAFAYELMARVYAMRGTIDQARAYYRMARAAGDVIQDSKNKAIFEADFAAGPWFQE